MKRIHFVLLISLVIIFPFVASAQQLPNPMVCDTLLSCLVTITTFLWRLGTPLAVIAIMIGAFNMMFSGGNEEKFTKGKQIITYTLIAYVILLISFGLPQLVQNILS